MPAASHLRRARVASRSVIPLTAPRHRRRRPRVTRRRRNDYRGARLHAAVIDFGRRRADRHPGRRGPSRDEAAGIHSRLRRVRAAPRQNEREIRRVVRDRGGQPQGLARVDRRLRGADRQVEDMRLAASRCDRSAGLAPSRPRLASLCREHRATEKNADRNRSPHVHHPADGPRSAAARSIYVHARARPSSDRLHAVAECRRSSSTRSIGRHPE